MIFWNADRSFPCVQDAKPDFEADVFEAGWEAKIVLKFYESMLRSDLTLKQTLQVRH